MQGRCLKYFPRNQRGSLTITAMWMLAIISLMAMSLMRSVIVGIKSDALAIHADEAKWISRAGIYHAMSMLQSDVPIDSNQVYDSMNEAWANSPSLFKQVHCGAGFFEITHAGEQHGIETTTFGIVDENRKINLNFSPAEMLARLPGMTQEKLDALLQWRRPDTLEIKSNSDADSFLRSNRGVDYKHDAFEFIEELALVPGFSQKDVFQLDPLVTVYGEGVVNINTASKEILEILGLDHKLAGKIVQFRRGADALPFTKDDVQFKNALNIVDELKKKLTLKASEQLLLNNLVSANILDVRSSHFTINSTGVVMNRQIVKSVSATVLRKADNNVEILRWQE